MRRVPLHGRRHSHSPPWLLQCQRLVRGAIGTRGPRRGSARADQCPVRWQRLAWRNQHPITGSACAPNAADVCRSGPLGLRSGTNRIALAQRQSIRAARSPGHAHRGFSRSHWIRRTKTLLGTRRCVRRLVGAQHACANQPESGNRWLCSGSQRLPAH